MKAMRICSAPDRPRRVPPTGRASTSTHPAAGTPISPRRAGLRDRVRVAVPTWQSLGLSGQPWQSSPAIQNQAALELSPALLFALVDKIRLSWGEAMTTYTRRLESETTDTPTFEQMVEIAAREWHDAESLECIGYEGRCQPHYERRAEATLTAISLPALLAIARLARGPHECEDSRWNKTGWTCIDEWPEDDVPYCTGCATTRLFADALERLDEARP
jgi:hypothetical protein